MRFFKFVCNYFDDDYGEQTSQGITVGKCLVEATQETVKYFGEEAIMSLTLEPQDNENVLVISEPLLSQLEKET